MRCFTEASRLRKNRNVSTAHRLLSHHAVVKNSMKRSEIKTHAYCTNTPDEVLYSKRRLSIWFYGMLHRSLTIANGDVTTSHQYLSHPAVMKEKYREDLEIRTHAYFTRTSDVKSACQFVSMGCFTEVAPLRKNVAVSTVHHFLSHPSII